MYCALYQYCELFLLTETRVCDLVRQSHVQNNVNCHGVFVTFLFNTEPDAPCANTIYT